MFTTVPSMNVIDDPMMVATRIQRRRSGAATSTAVGAIVKGSLPAYPGLVLPGLVLPVAVPVVLVGLRRLLGSGVLILGPVGVAVAGIVLPVRAAVPGMPSGGGVAGGHARSVPDPRRPKRRGDAVRQHGWRHPRRLPGRGGGAARPDRRPRHGRDSRRRGRSARAPPRRGGATGGRRRAPGCRHGRRPRPPRWPR